MHELFESGNYKQALSPNNPSTWVIAPLSRQRHTALYECVLIDWLIDNFPFLRLALLKGMAMASCEV